MTQNIPTAITMNARYQKGLAEFKQRCTDNLEITTFLTKLFQQDQCGLRSMLSSANKPWIADLGCGDGIITTHLAKILGHFQIAPEKSLVSQR